ncbi:MAG: protoporphyrinogen oxidase [Trueperaceae bacterium]
MVHNVIVIGGGISGLTAAFELRKRRPGWSILVLEKEDVAGGKVRSGSIDGFTVDWGPNGFQAAPHTLELVEELGLEAKLSPASDHARYRYLYRDGSLRRVPVKPREFLATELLSPAGKLRAALEPLLGRRYANGTDESVHDFVARHFGGEAARTLAATMVLGITAGDSRRLSAGALFPRMRQMERDHGSLLRAMASSRGSSTRGSSKGRRSAGAALYSFKPGGMGELTAALGRHLGDDLRTGTEVEMVNAGNGGGYEVTLTSGERLQTEQLVVATPAYTSARLLGPILAGATDALEQIPYAQVDVLVMAYHRVDVAHPLDGFGFLAPRGEGVRSLGAIWTSSLFEESAPAGTVFLRVLAGGVLDPGFGELEDAQAFAAVAHDLRLTLGVTAEPIFSQRISIPRAIPQYELGHRGRVERAMAAARHWPGLVLAGNAFHGVAVNDCVRDALRVADEMVGVNR